MGKVKIALIILWSLLLSACASLDPGEPQSSAEDPNAPPRESSLGSPAAADQQDSSETGPPQAGGSDDALCTAAFEGSSEIYLNTFWSETNFCNYNVDPNEIYLGIVPKDGIPAIDQPVFESIEDADSWLGDDWPVMWFEHEGDSRAYPLAILIWHEIVNDVVGGKPVSLTFCPLCNATIAFDRTLIDGTILDFGTTGNLRHSDLVMYDRQTQSWWQQFTGEAILGDLTGTQLDFLPSQIVSWADFKAFRPDGQVLSRQTGHLRSYGENPYPGYDSINSSPWFPGLGEDGRLPAMERVVAIQFADTSVAYPFTELEKVAVINDQIGDESVVILWKAGTRTTFGVSATDVGSTGAFSRELDGTNLTFIQSENGFEDQETGSSWNILGEATDGPLEGERLRPVVSGEHFWFAWSVFVPDSEVWSQVPVE